MSDILVYAEIRNGALQCDTLELLTAAQRLADVTGGKVEALCAHADPDVVLRDLAAADRVLTVKHPSLGNYVPEAHLAVLEEVVAQRNPAAVLFSYNTAGLDLAPALALRSSRPLVAYCSGMDCQTPEVEAESHIYSGKLRSTSKVALPAVFTVMPGAFPEAPSNAERTPETELLSPPEKLESLRSRFVCENAPPADAFDLTLADKIVCVGRGVGDKNGFEELKELAGMLDAEIAGSRPVIDQGWLPKERQVGKSGCKVKPKLYFAMGISGAPEHLEGMQGAELIIAVNSDAAAPIFGVAHYGANCDLFDLLPDLVERLRVGDVN